MNQETDNGEEEYSEEGEENYGRFIAEVIKQQAVWLLAKGENPAVAESDDYEGAGVMMFFSNKTLAQAVVDESYPDYKPDLIPLFDFLYYWLAGMPDDGMLAGTNWSADLVGLESHPDDLIEDIESSMDETMLKAYDEEWERQEA